MLVTTKSTTVHTALKVFDDEHSINHVLHYIPSETLTFEPDMNNKPSHIALDVRSAIQYCKCDMSQSTLNDFISEQKFIGRRNKDHVCNTSMERLLSLAYATKTGEERTTLRHSLEALFATMLYINRH